MANRYDPERAASVLTAKTDTKEITVATLLRSNFYSEGKAVEPFEDVTEMDFSQRMEDPNAVGLPTVIIVGGNRSGKTVMAKVVINDFAPYCSHLYVFTASPEQWKDTTSKPYLIVIDDTSDESVVREAMVDLDQANKRTRDAILRKNPRAKLPDMTVRAMFVFDDVTAHDKFMRSPVFNDLYTRATHTHIIPIVTAHDFKLLKPNPRSESEFVIFMDADPRNVEAMHAVMYAKDKDHPLAKISETIKEYVVRIAQLPNTPASVGMQMIRAAHACLTNPSMPQGLGLGEMMRIWITGHEEETGNKMHRPPSGDWDWSKVGEHTMAFLEGVKGCWTFDAVLEEEFEKFVKALGVSGKPRALEKRGYGCVFWKHSPKKDEPGGKIYYAQASAHFYHKIRPNICKTFGSDDYKKQRARATRGASSMRSIFAEARQDAGGRVNVRNLDLARGMRL